MAGQLSEIPPSDLKRARDHEVLCRTALCADYWQEEAPGEGVGVGVEVA